MGIVKGPQATEASGERERGEDDRVRPRADDRTIQVSPVGRDILQGAATPVGGSVGRYVVLEEVGRGSMGRVLRAYDPKLQREVALKELHDDALDAASNERLSVEARAMAKLSHPNVVAVQRGLSPEPRDRWPTLDGLLAALAYDPGRRRNRIAAGDDYAEERRAVAKWLQRNTGRP